MQKQTFIAAIKALQKQNEQDSKNAEILTQVFPDAYSANLLYPTHLLSNTLMVILHEAMGDTYRDKAGMTWTEYWCFELDFGKRFETGSVISKGENIDLSTPEALYDFLISNSVK